MNQVLPESLYLTRVRAIAGRTSPNSYSLCLELTYHLTLPQLKMVDAAREKLKAELAASPSFKAELKDRLKTALLGKVPASQPLQHNFDS